MLDAAKYVITQDGTVIVFGGGMAHSDFKHLQPTSAGFVYFNVDKDGKIEPQCFGESKSLGIGSNPQDAIPIRLQLIEDY